MPRFEASSREFMANCNSVVLRGVAITEGRSGSLNIRYVPGFEAIVGLSGYLYILRFQMLDTWWNSS